jgi:hypothetical protein
LISATLSRRIAALSFGAFLRMLGGFWRAETSSVQVKLPQSIFVHDCPPGTAQKAVEVISRWRSIFEKPMTIRDRILNDGSIGAETAAERTFRYHPKSYPLSPASTGQYSSFEL